MSPEQAARVAGTTRWTILRAINAQRLRAIRDNRNRWRIAPDDLDNWRAHSVRTPDPAHPAAHPAPGGSDPLATVLADLRADLDRTRQELDAVRSQVADLRVEAADARAQAEGLDRLRIAHEATVADLRRRLDDAHAKLLPPPAPAAPLAPAPGILARLRGLLRS